MMNKLFKNKIANNQALGMLMVFILGLLCGIWIIHEKEEICFSKYNFVNHHVACTHDPVISKAGYAKTQKEVEQYINEEIASGNITEAAVYFRDLENGPVWGINEISNFAPASLLKLPLILVYLTIAERDPEILKQKIVFKGENIEYAPLIIPAEKLVIGEEYTSEELIKRVLKYSDNDSYFTLVRNLEESGMNPLIRETFLEFGIIAPESMYDEVVTVRGYASIFRSLYNSSFLNSDLSDQVLGWLSKSEFKDGLASLLPENIKIAHKFGERFAPDGSKQLHDCGIIYYPANPYLLCVMTKGEDLEKQARVIGEISGKIYQEVESRKVREIN